MFYAGVIFYAVATGHVVALRRLGDIAKSHLKEAHTHTITKATINDDDVIWLPTLRVCLPLWMVCCLVVTLP